MFESKSHQYLHDLTLCVRAEGLIDTGEQILSINWYEPLAVDRAKAIIDGLSPEIQKKIYDRLEELSLENKATAAADGLAPIFIRLITRVMVYVCIVALANLNYYYFRISLHWTIPTILSVLLLSNAWVIFRLIKEISNKDSFNPETYEVKREEAGLLQRLFLLP
ncbi:MAG: hypothetical protein EOP06_00860 [Proteobacteria bacterium]|nr:MAG: hypothetical protein EOP06_00860 [Pseudomonadota bacterium]